MLDASLENLLESTLTGERYKLYSDIISYLESIEYETIQDELLNLTYSPMDTEGEKIDKPESTILDEMHSHLQRVLEDQLGQSGVTIAEGTDLKDTFELAVGILHIAEHEDVDAIVATASSDDGPLDQMADILELVTTHPAEHWLTLLDSVSSQLMKRISELSKLRGNTSSQEMDDTSDYLPKLRIYSEYCSTKERTLKTLQSVGSVILGRTFEDYMNSGIVSDMLDGDEMQRLALELYCLTIMSSDGRNDPITIIRTTIEKYLIDTPRIIKVNREIEIINAEFVKFFQTTSKGLTNQNGQA